MPNLGREHGSNLTKPHQEVGMMVQYRAYFGLQRKVAGRLVSMRLKACLLSKCLASSPKPIPFQITPCRISDT